MERATDAVLAKQAEINASLDELESVRKQRGLRNGELGEVDLRTAAYVLAIDRVALVTLERGIWP